MQSIFSLALNGQLAQLPLSAIQKYQTPGTAETATQTISRELLLRVIVIGAAVFSVSDIAVNTVTALGELTVALIQMPACYCPGLKHLQPRIHLIQARSHGSRAAKLIPALFEGFVRGIVRPENTLLVYKKWVPIESSEGRPSKWALLTGVGMTAFTAGEYFLSLSSVIRTPVIPVIAGTLEGLSLASMGTAGMAIFAVGAATMAGFAVGTIVCSPRSSNTKMPVIRLPQADSSHEESDVESDGEAPVGLGSKRPATDIKIPSAEPTQKKPSSTSGDKSSGKHVGKAAPKPNTPPKRAEPRTVVLVMNEFPSGVPVSPEAQKIIDSIESQRKLITNEHPGYIQISCHRLPGSVGEDSGTFLGWTHNGKMRIWYRWVEHDIDIDANITGSEHVVGKSPVSNHSVLGANLVGTGTKINLTGDSEAKRKQLGILAKALTHSEMGLFVTHKDGGEEKIKIATIENNLFPNGVGLDYKAAYGWYYKDIVSARIARNSDVKRYNPFSF